MLKNQPVPSVADNKSVAIKFILFFVIYELTTYLSNDMVMPSMLQVVQQYHASLSEIAYSLSYYVIGGSLLQVFLGPLSEIFGKRRVLLCGNVLFLLATIGIVCAHSMQQFLVGRLFQGMGLCFIFIGYAMVHELFDDVNAVKVTAIMTNIVIFAPLLGPLIGGAIAAVTHWQFVFIIAGTMGVISLIGLYLYMPQQIHLINNNLDIMTICNSYRKILSSKIFMFGIFTCGVTLIPTIAWIGLAPTMIMGALHQSIGTYVISQGVIFGGFIISSLLIGQIAGKFSFNKIMHSGAFLILVGAIFIGMANHHEYLVVAGMCIYTLGEGLCYGILVRIALTNTGESMNLSSSAMSLLNCIYLASGLALANLICGHFGYSISAYALMVCPLGIISAMLIIQFCRVSSY